MASETGKATWDDRRRWEREHGHPDPYRDIEAVARLHAGHTQPTQFDRLHAAQWMERNAIGARPWDRKPDPLPADPNVRAFIGCYQDMESMAGRCWWALDHLKPTGSLEDVRAYVDRLIREHTLAMRDDAREPSDLIRRELMEDRA